MKSISLIFKLALILLIIGIVLTIFGTKIEKYENRAKGKAAAVKVIPPRIAGKKETKICPQSTTMVNDTAKKIAAIPVSLPKVSISPASDYIPPQKLEKMAFENVFQKKREELLEFILGNRWIKKRVREESEIETSVECGIKVYPKIMADYGQMIGDSMMNKLSDPSLGIPPTISLPVLGVAIVSVESQGDKKAKSKKDAHGLWQVIIPTAHNLCSDLHRRFPSDRRAQVAMLNDPSFSTSLGTSHLLRSARYFHGDVKKMLAGYEIGDGKVEDEIRWYGGIDNIPYVRKVMPVYDTIIAHLNEPLTQTPPDSGSKVSNVLVSTNPD
jgi:Transglycosylase SLT domain